MSKYDVFDDEDEAKAMSPLGCARAKLVRAQAEVKVARLELRELEEARMRELEEFEEADQPTQME